MKANPGRGAASRYRQQRRRALRNESGAVPARSSDRTAGPNERERAANRVNDWSVELRFGEPRGSAKSYISPPWELSRLERVGGLSGSSSHPWGVPLKHGSSNVGTKPDYSGLASRAP